MAGTDVSMRPLLRYLRRHLAPIVLGLFCLTICNFCELLQPYILKRFIHLLTGGAAVVPSALLMLVGLLLLAGLGRSMFSFLQRWLLIGTSRLVEYDLRNDLFRHLQKLAPSYYVRTKTGDLMSRATSDINAVRMLLGMGLMLLVDTLNLLGVSLLFMLHTSPFLTAVAMTPLLILPFAAFFFNREIHLRYEAMQEQVAVLSARVQENLSGVRVVKAFV